MMSQMQVADLRSVKATEAKRRGLVPVVVDQRDLDTEVGFKDLCAHIPFLGECEPEGFIRTTGEYSEMYFVDSSGLGSPGEAALTVEQFKDRVKADYQSAEKDMFLGIYEAGEFQIYIARYEAV